MKNKILTLLIILFSFHTIAQVKGTIINQKDKKPIPYVNIWVTNGNVGTTSNENGVFNLLNVKLTDTLLFSALGFENKVLAYADVKVIVELSPKVFELQEIKVNSKKKNLEYNVGTFKGLKINAFYASSLKYPNLYARYFPFKKEYNNTQFIKQIMPYCKSNLRNAKFRLRLFEANEKGEPDKELISSGLIITVKKGDTKPIINVENYNIVFPENGLFVGFEFMYIDSNIYNYVTNFTENGVLTKNKKSISLEPSFGVIKGESNEVETWGFSKNKWMKRQMGRMGDTFGPDGKDLIAIELTLTN